MTTELLRMERYRIEQPLGRGAMGTVLLARDTVLDRLVAVKVLADHLAADEAFRRRFLQEARLAARLGHPNVVQVFDAGDDGAPFLVMEYVDGETIADRLARQQAFSAAEVLTLAAHLSAGLAHAHDRGIVHRDVKPHNVLVRRDGVAKLTDFGIARALEESGLTEIGTVLGTAPYMAPEQAAGQAVGPAADVYALGALLRQAGSDALPPGLASLVDAALATDPADRPSAADIHQRLVALIDEPTRALPAQPIPTLAGGGPDSAPTEIASPAPTVIAGTWPPPTGPAPGARELARPAILAGVLILLLVAILALAGGDGSGREPAESTGVAPVPAAPGPAQSARNLADWLRGQAE